LNDQEIDDALSVAVFRAWAKVHTFRAAKGSLSAWFFVIASNVGREILRTRQRRGREVHMPDLECVFDPGALIPAPRAHFLELLQECIAALPDLQRHIIEADLQSGDVADAAELATALRTTKNSVYVSRSVARKTLRAALTARGYEPGDDATPRR
jgi:DNA-directed RNA polymerase specialized sigma24 family protein